MGAELLWSILVHDGEEVFGGPGAVVVGDHAAFGIAGCSTGVDQEGALPWLLALHLLEDAGILDPASLSHFHEIFP